MKYEYESVVMGSCGFLPFPFRFVFRNVCRISISVRPSVVNCLNMLILSFGIILICFPLRIAIIFELFTIFSLMFPVSRNFLVGYFVSFPSISGAHFRIMSRFSPSSCAIRTLYTHLPSLSLDFCFSIPRAPYPDALKHKFSVSDFNLYFLPSSLYSERWDKASSLSYE
jgi:hypothetical protein